MASVTGYVNPEWLDEQFVERALREGEADPDIVVKHIQVKAATAVGDNYASLMYRVSVEFVRGSGEIEKQSMIVKAPPQTESMKDIFTDFHIFTIESDMYKKILPAMEKLLKGADKEKYKPFAPKGVYFDPDETLVLEDLSVSGFRMAERHKGLDLDHSKLAIQRLAMFHAASVVLADKDPSSMLPYRSDLYAKSKKIESFFSNAFRSLSEEVRTWPEYSEKYADKLLKLSENIYSRCIEKRKRVKSDFNVLNHGDCWINNMMFKYSEAGQVIDHRFVDYQGPYYGSPAIDIHNLLSTSLSPFVKINHYEELFLEYHSTLCDTLEDLGYVGKVPSYLEFKQELDEKEVLVVLSTLGGLQFILADPDKTPNLEDFLGENSDDNHNASFHYSDIFKTEVKKSLHIFDKKGLLD